MTWERYTDRWTRLSYLEMVNFTGWMNELFGYYPTIIGGWAVHMLSPRGFGSRDIDVVIPTWEMKYRVVDEYLRANGYVLVTKAFGVKEWIKELVPGDPDSVTYLDICTLADRNLVHGMDIEIPWRISQEIQQIMEIEGHRLYIPRVEALLLLKSKAAWDRNYDIQSGGPNPFLSDKLKKDRFDILSLLNSCEVDIDLLCDLTSKYGFNAPLKDVMIKALSEQEVLDELQKRFEDPTLQNKRAKNILNRL